MEIAARKLSEEEEDNNSNKDKDVIIDTLKRIDNTLTQELIIGLCGPIGTDIHNVSGKIEKLLTADYNYKVHVIKLSHLISQNSKIVGLENMSKYSRIKKLIEEGDKLREDHSKSILAELAVKKILVDRQKEKEKQKKQDSKSEGENESYRRVCYIIDSIKNEYEYELFKNVYRELFYFFGCFSPKDQRVENLKKDGLSESEIFTLIDQDSGEEKDSGQSVAKTFVKADFFIRIDNNIRRPLESKLERYFHLIFDTDIITPYPDETAMYHATSAASNSSCLSRQVGVAITDINGDLLAVGWNDVPKFGGGVYQSNKNDIDGVNDHRCKCLDPKKCFNSHKKKGLFEELKKITISLNHEIINNILIELSSQTKDKISKSNAQKIKELANTEFEKRILSELEKSKVKDLIEFSRSIHAEMHAIIVGSQKNADKMLKGKLYCTTFPCHNCARHIVMAGIQEVYYIEPYPKSLAEELHSDSLTTSITSEKKVKIRMYDGVAPNRYIDLFKNIKDNRKSKPIPTKIAKPKFQLTLADLEALESLVQRLIPKNFKYADD